MWRIKSKVKVTLVQALRLCTGRTAHRGSRRVALLFLDHDTRTEWGVIITLRLLFTPGKDPVPIVQEAGWAPGPVCTGAENFAPTGVRSPDRPARSQSLYRLRYPVHVENSSSVGATARCGFWPVEQYLSICPCLSPNPSTFHSQHLKIFFHFFSPSFPGSSSSSRPFRFLSEDLFGHPILLHSVNVTQPTYPLPLYPFYYIFSFTQLF